MQDPAFSFAEGAAPFNHLADTEKDGQAFKKAQAIFIQADTISESQNELLIEWIVFADTDVK